jgi:hypothetical protein
VTDGTVVWTCAGPDVQPKNLSGYTAYMTVATQVNPATADILATISTTSNSQGAITLSDSEGIISVSIDGETTLGFTSKTLYYDLFLVSSTDVTTMLLTGKIAVNFNVTTPVYQ